MEKSIRFYHEILGLPVIKRFGGVNRPEIAFLGDDETQIELVCNKEELKEQIGKSITVGFEVANLDDMIDKLQTKLIPVHDGPYQPSSKLRFFYVLDPDGVSIQFVERRQ